MHVISKIDDIVFQVSYVAFLLLYSYVILFDFKLSVSVAEWILIGWIGTMMVEEIREVIQGQIQDFPLGGGGAPTSCERLKSQNRVSTELEADWQTWQSCKQLHYL